MLSTQREGHECCRRSLLAFKLSELVCLSSRLRLSHRINLTNKVFSVMPHSSEGELRKADSRGNLDRSTLSAHRKLLAPPHGVVHDERDRRQSRAEEYHRRVRRQAEEMLDPVQQEIREKWDGQAVGRRWSRWISPWKA